MVSTSRRPMVMVSGAGGLHRKGGRSPPPKRGRLGGGRCICDTLLSPSACSTEGFFRRKNAFRIQRSRAPERGLSRGNLSPLTLFWFLLQGQKKRHGGEPYKLSPCGDLSPPKAITSYITNTRRKAHPRLATLLPFCGLTGRRIFTIMELENTPERSI